MDAGLSQTVPSGGPMGLCGSLCRDSLKIYDCANNGSQFIIVTHSPILLGIPNAEILTFDNGRIHACDYEDTDTYQITEMFINHRNQFLERLLMK